MIPPMTPHDNNDDDINDLIRELNDPDSMNLDDEDMTGNDDGDDTPPGPGVPLRAGGPPPASRGPPPQRNAELRHLAVYTTALDTLRIV